jgi:hypothetical protein
MSEHYWKRLSLEFAAAGRRVGKVFRNLQWAMKNAPITDDERFAFNLAIRHIREGKPMLAQEDLAWLERRLRRG